MTTDEQIDLDLHALAEETAKGLPSLERTKHVVRAAREPRRRPPFVAMALGAVALAGALVCPVPYTRVAGYDLHVRGADGHETVVNLPAVSSAQAERRAQALRSHGAAVSVSARTQHVWGPMIAMANEKLFKVDVATDGKSDLEVEAEITQQLARMGWNPSTVTYRRENGEATTVIGANDGSGREMKIVQKTPDGDPVAIEEPPPLDTKREPGMTDEGLRQKILAQLQARGMKADVAVEGDRVRIRAEHEAPEK